MNRTGIRPPQRSTSAPWVLSISQNGTDYRDLSPMVDPTWTLVNASTLRSGLDTLARVRVAVVICDTDLWPGSWHDILEHLENWSAPPHLIVSSRLADEALWAEALNLGAYDALAKPFRNDEVRRVLNAAWHNWMRKHHTGVLAKPIPEFALMAAMKTA